jgi:hypothetical protein
MVHASSSMSVGNFSLPEIMMRYFPQLQASFRRVFLQDLNISLTKNQLIQEEIFPLSFNQDVLRHVGTFYTFETHIIEIFEKEYQYQIILPSSKETILFVDYIYVL